ncbi:MAG TPA: hypothetical protein VIX17_25465 [Pyrinomonadaceae bacterium]
MPNSPLVFGDFLESLRLQDFSITISHYLRLEALLSRIGSDCRPQDLKTILCPIFATNETEQERFYKHYDQFYNYGSSIESGAEVAESLDVPEPEEDQKQEADQKKNRRALVIGLSIVAVIVAIVLIKFVMTAPGEVTPGNTTPTPTPTPEATVSPPPPLTAAFIKNLFEDPGTLFRILLTLLPLIAFALYELNRRSKQRERRLEDHHPSQPGIPIKFGASLAEVYDPDELTRVARLLRARQLSGTLRLDIVASVIATVRALGFFTLREKAVSKPPEYLVLIDRAAFRDHQSRLFHELVRKLNAEGVFVSCYYFEGDPRVSFLAPFETTGAAPVVRSPEAQRKVEEEARWAQRGVTLDELHDLYTGHRLLIFGEGTDLIDQVTLQTVDWIRSFAHWQERAILTPRPPSLWDAQEFALSQQFVVMPATLNGVELTAESFAIREPVSIPENLRGDPSRMPHDIDSAEDLPALRAYLGDRLFQWLCACAVHPQLQWDLTMCLGAQFATQTATQKNSSQGVLTEENLLRLFSLPWFRVGTIPDVVRARLMRQLSARSETTVRQTIAELIDKAAQSEIPLESSQVIRVPLSLEVDASQGDQLFRRSRDLRDNAFKRFLQPQPLVLYLKNILPAWLQQLLFTPFGLRGAVKVALVVLVSLLVWVTFPTLAAAFSLGESTNVNANRNVNVNVNSDSNANFPLNGNVNANVTPSPVESPSPIPSPNASPFQTPRPTPSPSSVPSSPSPVATPSFAPSPRVSPTPSIQTPTPTPTSTPTPTTRPSPSPSTQSGAGIFKFDLDRSTIQSGDKTVLNFDARLVSAVKITPGEDSEIAKWNAQFAGFGEPRNFQGSIVLQPRITTTYTITAAVNDRPDLARPTFRTVTRQVTLTVVDDLSNVGAGSCKPFSAQLNTLSDIDVSIYLVCLCAEGHHAGSDQKRAVGQESCRITISYGSPKADGSVTYSYTAKGSYEMNAMRNLASKGLPKSFIQMMRRDVYPVLKQGDTNASRKALADAVRSLFAASAA